MSYVRNFRPAGAGHYLVNYVEGKSINGNGIEHVPVEKAAFPYSILFC